MKDKELLGDSRFTRRNFLRGAGALGMIGATGNRIPNLMDPAIRLSDEFSSTTIQPVETGWKAQQSPLTTPWTNQVSAGNCLPEYPRPQMSRTKWINLNGVWQFAAARKGSKPPTGRDLGERILVPFPVESAISGINRHEERMFYRRRFIVPSDWNVKRGSPDSPHQRLLLHFDAVDFEAHVWVNGTLVGVHKGGYDRFSFDVTDALLTGKTHKPHGEQELIVGVYDPTEKGDQPLGKQRVRAIDNPRSALYYTPASGIWQTVWMEPVPASYIEHLKLTPRLDDNTLRLWVHAVNAHLRAIEVTAYDGGRAIASATGQPNQEIALHIPRPKLWSPDSPFLYDLKVRLVDSSQNPGTAHTHRHRAIHDEVKSYFGMRSIDLKTIRGNPHITLNGTFTFQLSTLQQGYWPDGIYTAATDDALRFDLEQAKQLGFNTVRKHQKLEPDRWYYHADKLGLLVWQDIPATAGGVQAFHGKGPLPQPDSATKQEYLAELHHILHQFHNHPSIAIWIPFNEGWGEFDTARIAGLVKKLDPSRLVDQMSGFNVCGCGFGSGDISDRHNLRGIWPGPPPPVEPHRATVIGEFGAYAYSVPNHTWDPEHSHPHLEVAGAEALTKDYVHAMQQIHDFAIHSGLSGANYNLFADVEHQVNGLFTYDRKVLKANKARVQQANAMVLAAATELFK